MRTAVFPFTTVSLLILFLAGCHALPRGPDQAGVSQALAERVGHHFPPSSAPSSWILPPGASLEDGLTEEEAIAIALWNNPAFQELLVDLGIAHADLVQAGLLPNPEAIFFIGVPDKPYKYALELPIEALWLRPIRLRIALDEADRVAERLTQAGLDLMRDVRQAYADTLLARERLRIAEEGVKLRGRIASFAKKRLEEGDISEQEAATAGIDALQARQDAARIGFEVPIAEERLRNLMGMGERRDPLTLDPTPLPGLLTYDIHELTRQAQADRPDARAAREALAAAEARVSLARLGWFRFMGIADATSGRATGHELGPALRFTLPIFNRNQGGIARAEAERERAERQIHSLENQISLEVRRAALQAQQMATELAFLRTQVRPEVELAIRRAEKSYDEGNVTYLLALESTRQLLDTYLREAQLEGDLRRAWAEFERAVGRKITGTPPATSAR